MKHWEAWTNPDGMVSIQQADGSIIIVKNDGSTGYSFALDYLQKMQVHYRNHLRAADLILQRQLGDKYKYVRQLPNLYNSNLALVSMNCVFGNMDHIPDCDEKGTTSNWHTVPSGLHAPITDSSLQTRERTWCAATLSTKRA